jgi:hypothetical protein
VSDALKGLGAELPVTPRRIVAAIAAGREAEDNRAAASER